MAEIRFSERGTAEEIVPDVKVTRSKTGNSGTATFYFEDPKILGQGNTDEIQGLFLVDEEGSIVSREVKGKFVNGKARGIEAVLIMKSAEEFERFVRFMEKYATENGLNKN